MARALSHDVRLIVMDELVRRARPGRGRQPRYRRRPHRRGRRRRLHFSPPEEIRRIGDRVTVLKDGRAVAGGLPAESTPTREVVALMTGRNVEYVFPERPAGPLRATPCGACGAWPGGRVRPSTWRSDPERSSASPDSSAPAAPRSLRRSTGPARRVPARSSSTGSRCARAACAPRARRARARPRGTQGAGPADAGVRHPQRVGLRHVPLHAAAGSTAAPNSGRRAATREAVPAARQPSAPVRTLLRRQPAEGGPRPLGRSRGCKVLLLDEPTRCVDVGARAELYAVVRRLADEGLAVLPVSSEVPEVLWPRRPRAGAARGPLSCTRPPPVNSTNTAYSTS